MKTAVRKAAKRRKIPAQEQSGPIVREHGTWAVGDVAHQGDLIFVCIGSFPAAKPRANRQLAEGDTQGSRHVLDGGKCFDISPRDLVALVRDATHGKVVPSEQCCGPIFAGPAFVRHPQHQDQGFPAGTVTAVIAQRNLDAEEREIRARD